MIESKPLIASRAFWGGVVVFVAWVLSTAAGVELAPDEQQVWVDRLVAVGDEVLAIVGLALATWGTVKRNKRIGGVFKADKP